MNDDFHVYLKLFKFLKKLKIVSGMNLPGGNGVITDVADINELYVSYTVTNSY